VNAIGGVILDYGGVIIDEDPSTFDAMGRPFGFEPGQVWSAFHDIPEYRPSRVGAISRREFREAVRRSLGRLRGDDAADRVLDAVTAYYRSQPPIAPVMIELLDILRERARLGLLSNAPRGSTRRLEESGVAARFDAVVCSGDVGVAKPDIGAYQLVSERLGLAPEACLFVDDLEANVQAARASGMHAHLYRRSRHADLVSLLARHDLVRPR
jgi:putative hydrolase of the HAD superfamily